MGDFRQIVLVVFSRCDDIAAILAGLRGCFGCSRPGIMLFHFAVYLAICADPGMTGGVLIQIGRTPAVIFGITVGAAKSACMEMIHLPTGDPLGGVRDVIFIFFHVFIAADAAFSFCRASSSATLVIFLL